MRLHDLLRSLWLNKVLLFYPLVFIAIFTLDYRHNHGTNILIISGLLVGYTLLMKIINYTYLPTYIARAAYFPFYVDILGGLAIHDKISWARVMFDLVCCLLIFRLGENLRKHKY